MAEKEAESIEEIFDRMTSKRRSRVVTGMIRGGRRMDILTVGTRGRYVKHRDGSGEGVKDIAILPTIKAAIMRTGGKDMVVKRIDFKEKVRRRKISSLMCIVIDTSSSMLQGGRMRTARKVFQEILLNAYRKRDRVAVVTFSGQESDVILPFTTGVEQGQKKLDDVDFGGTTPLSAGIIKGIELLALKMKQERHTVPILVLISDGASNTPLAAGRDVKEDLANSFRKLDDAPIKFLSVDVGEGNTGMKELTESVGGEYYKPQSIEGEGIFEDYTDMRILRNIMAEVLLHPGMGNLVIVDREGGLFPLINDDLKEVTVTRNVVEGCFYRCDPERPEAFCEECRLKHKAGELKVVEAKSDLVVLNPKEPLFGEPYIRYVIIPSQVEKARRGVLLVKEMDRLHKKVLSELMTAVSKGRRETKGQIAKVSYPVITTLVCTVRDPDKMPPELEGVKYRLFDPVSVPERIRLLSIIYQRKEFERDPEGFERNLRKERDSAFADERKLFQQAVGLGWEDEAGEILASVREPVERRRLKALARRRAAVRRHGKVLAEDVRAVSALEARRSRGGVDPYLLAWNLLPAMLMPSLGRVLVTGVDADSLLKALEVVRAVLPDIPVAADCQFNCHPEGEGGYCYPCEVKHLAGKLEGAPRGVPLERVGPATTMAALLGERYVRYVFRPGILARANRGILLVEEPEGMSSELLGSVLYSLESGLNFPLGSGGRMSHPSKFKLVVHSQTPEDVPPRVLGTVSYHVDVEHLDESRTVTKEDLARVMANVSKLDEVEVTEGDLDLISRLCDQLDVPGNIRERNIVDMARTLAYLEGASVLEQNSLEKAINFCLVSAGE